MTITSGETVGPYRVIEQLGSGGMATVFKAYHASLDRYVAIKVLHPAFKADPQFFERFKREARIVANLEHPHIIPVYDFNEHHGEPYLVMRYIEGNTLKPLMQGQPMPPSKILGLMRPICLALNYAHKQGALHRDVKPSNIMVTHDGSIFLTDFGLARMVQAGESTLSQDMMVGTPQYISPEQAQGISNLDGRTDIYSLGVVLFEMLTGRVPFNADTPFATIHNHIYSPLPLPSTINPDIDPAAERMLLKALAKEPNDRFATAGDLLQTLESTMGPQPARIAAPPPPPIVSQSNVPWWAWAGIATLSVCVLGGLLVGLLMLRSGNNRLVRPSNTSVTAPVVNSNLPSQNNQTATNVEAPLTTQQDAAAPSADAQSAGAQSTDTQNPDTQNAVVQNTDIQSTEQDTPATEQLSETPATVTPESVEDTPPAGQQADDLTQQGNNVLRQQQFRQAIPLFEEAIALDPHHVPAYLGLSQAQRQAGNNPASIAALEQAVANNPDSAFAWLRLGEAQLFIMDDPATALSAFQQASALDPEAALAYAGQAMALINLQQLDAAKQAIDTALTLNPDSPEAHLANAFYLKEQGDRRGALQELRQIVQNNNASLLIKERARKLLLQMGG